MPIDSVSRMLGDRSIKTTQIYEKVKEHSTGFHCGIAAIIIVINISIISTSLSHLLLFLPA